jgi:hypothetical protein
MRDLATEMVVADMVRGAPSVYATYVGYDEVAHHDGVERPAALDQLRLLDRTFARIARATKYAPRPYHIVVLSDHGQSQGVTFLQRYGITLEELVRHLTGIGEVTGYTSDVESVAQLSGAIGTDQPLTGVGDRDTSHGQVGSAPSELIVMASGCLGLVYFGSRKTRATRAELDEQYPGLIDGLARHPGVGWILIADDDGDGVVIGGSGEVTLSDGSVTGTSPLAVYDDPGLTLTQIRRHHTFTHNPDLLIMGRWDPESGEVPAFEELIGSHGGIGGEQTEPFVLFPSDLEYPDGAEVLGAGSLHHVLKSWTPSSNQPQASHHAKDPEAPVAHQA